MEETQKYLNGILSKRMGSVPNFSKHGNSVTRIPKKEENVESMPTVFRKKHQTIYHPTTSTHQSQFRTKSVAQSISKHSNKAEQQRVQYMLVSKRIQNRQEQIIAPAVDVSKYRQSSRPLKTEPALTQRQVPSPQEQYMMSGSAYSTHNYTNLAYSTVKPFKADDIKGREGRKRKKIFQKK